MKIRITKGIEAAGKFPFGHMSDINRDFLIANIGETFNAERICINGYILDVKLPNNKEAFVHVYNAFEIN